MQRPPYHMISVPSIEPPKPKRYAMRISPAYDEIKSRALELLNSESGFIGHTREEIWSRKTSRWYRWNCIGVALCMARDEIQQRERKLNADMTLRQWRVAKRRTKFTTGNFKKAEAELNKLITSRST